MIESEADSKRLDLAVDFPTNEFVNEVQYTDAPALTRRFPRPGAADRVRRSLGPTPDRAGR